MPAPGDGNSSPSRFRSLAEELRRGGSPDSIRASLAGLVSRTSITQHGSLPVFYRSEAILGRDVRNCHPPRSVHYVDQILADFKSGRETSAQFWKHMGKRFIHIRFVALHDANGGYLGTMEIAQDITHLRTLEGLRVELQYDPSE